MRDFLALLVIFAASLAFVAACNACSAKPPPPATLVTVADASVDLCEGNCAGQQTYCPCTMLDGGVPACVAWCHESNAKHTSSSTTIPALTCTSSATSKAAYVACGTMSACP